MNNLEQIEAALSEIKEDYEKGKGGNKAAGTRVRKAMQEVKNLAQEIRKEMLETREASPS
ncbi:MAG: histone H1 [Planctomycetota bacterium]